MAKAEKQESVSIPAVEKKRVVINIVGDMPLITHPWSEKAKKQMLANQTGRAKSKGHDPKNPVEDFIESMYWLEGKPTEYTEQAFEEAIENGARFGFPAVAFKSAAVAGAYRAGVTKNKVSMQGAFQIDCEMVEIESDAPIMREDTVRVGMGTADLRYRGQFDNWKAKIPVTFCPSIISLEQLVNLFNLGGFTCGVGEWRIEKGGTYGAYHVE